MVLKAFGYLALCRSVIFLTLLVLAFLMPIEAADYYSSLAYLSTLWCLPVMSFTPNRNSPTRLNRFGAHLAVSHSQPQPLKHHRWEFGHCWLIKSPSCASFLVSFFFWILTSYNMLKPTSHPGKLPMLPAIILHSIISFSNTFAFVQSFITCTTF